MKRGIRHNDVAWRNVGVFCDERQTKAVVFDMTSVVKNENGNDNEDWVKYALKSLSEKMTDRNNIFHSFRESIPQYRTNNKNPPGPSV